MGWHGDGLKPKQVVLEVFEPTPYSKDVGGQTQGYGDTREGETASFDCNGRGEFRESPVRVGLHPQ